MPNETEEVITQNDEVELEEVPEEQEETVEELKKKLATVEAQKEHWREKATKDKKEEKQEKTQGLSIEDTLYLAKTDIHEDDVADVLKYAQKMEIGVKEAHAFYKPILKERAEIRATALATQTGKGNRGSKGAVDSETVLRKAQEGGVGEDEIDRLVEARMEQRSK